MLDYCIKYNSHTGKFVSCVQYLVQAEMYLVFNLRSNVGNKQKIYCLNLLFSTTKYFRTTLLKPIQPTHAKKPSSLVQQT